MARPSAMALTPRRTFGRRLVGMVILVPLARTGGCCRVSGRGRHASARLLSDTRAFPSSPRNGSQSGSAPLRYTYTHLMKPRPLMPKSHNHRAPPLEPHHIHTRTRDTHSIRGAHRPEAEGAAIRTDRTQ